jgi:RNA polymerase sigma factor (sigma-70 family)
VDKTDNLTIIYNKYVDDLFAYGTNLGFDSDIVKDSIHDIFVKIAFEQNTFSNIVNVKFYLLKSLKNKLLDTYKTERKKISLDNINIDNELEFNIDVNIEDLLIKEEDRDDIKNNLQNMLDVLTDRQREIIYLRYIQEYSYEEISELLEISVHGCRKLMSRAISTLREKFIYLLAILII